MGDLVSSAVVIALRACITTQQADRFVAFACGSHRVRAVAKNGLHGVCLGVVSWTWHFLSCFSIISSHPAGSRPSAAPSWRHLEIRVLISPCRSCPGANPCSRDQTGTGYFTPMTAAAQRGPFSPPLASQLLFSLLRSNHCSDCSGETKSHEK